MQTRKNFLAAGAIAALVPRIAAAATPSPGAASSPFPSATGIPSDIPPLNFELSAFDSALAKPAAHRHLFASVELDRGEVFGAMRNTLNAYHDALAVPYADILPVAVLYHASAIALAFDDAVWNELFIPGAAKGHPKLREAFAGAAKGGGNPYLHADKKADPYDAAFETLASDAGARIFVCNLATIGYSHIFARALHLTAGDVYARLRHGLLPGAMLVPAGVWAVHAVQERRFTLLQTSL